MVPYFDSYYPYDYGMNYGVSQNFDVKPVLIIYVLLVGLLFLGSFVSYLFRGFGLYGIAKRKGHTLPWLSFFPFARTYLQGELAGKITLGKREMKHPGLWLLLVPMIAGAVFMVIYIAAIILFVIFIMTLGSVNSHSNGATAAGLMFFVSVIVIIALIVQAVKYALTGLINFNIHKQFVSDSAALIHMLLGLFVPLYQSIYFFIIRNRPLSSEKSIIPVTWEQQSVNPVHNSIDESAVDTSDDIDF